MIFLFRPKWGWYVLLDVDHPDIRIQQTILTLSSSSPDVNETTVHFACSHVGTVPSTWAPCKRFTVHEHFKR